MIGGFSAGKSTLLNTFLGQKLLPEAVTPETAVPAELHYTYEEKGYIEAFKENGECNRYSIDDLINIKDNAQNYQFLRIYLKNPNLAQIYPVVLVDMPGFDADSNTSAHHKRAIETYIERGICYIVLSAVSKGTIEDSLTKQIAKLQEWDKDFVFGLTKTDLRTASEVQDVENNIRELLEDNFDYDKDIPLFNNRQKNNNALEKLITAINPNQKFKDLFLDSIYTNNSLLQGAIETQLNTLSAEKKDIDDTLKYLNSEITRITENKEKKVKTIESRYSNKTSDVVIGLVTNAIRAKESHLIDLALKSADSFSNEMGELIKTNLTSGVKKRLEEISMEIISDFAAEMHYVLANVQGAVIDDSFVENIKRAAQNLMNQVEIGKFTPQNKSNFTSDSMLLSSLATIISMVFKITNPIVSTIVKLLPNFISSLFGGNSSSGPSEADIREINKQNIRSQLNNSVIPQVEREIKLQLDQMTNAHIKSIIERIAGEFEKQLKNKVAEIKQSIEEKSNFANNLADRKTQLANAKEKLETIAKELKSL